MAQYYKNKYIWARFGLILRLYLRHGAKRHFEIGALDIQKFYLRFEYLGPILHSARPLFTTSTI